MKRTKNDDAHHSSRRRRKIAAVLGIMALVGLLAWLAGGRSHESSPSTHGPADLPVPAGAAVSAERREVEDFIDVPATVTSRQVANVAPRIMARVLDVRVATGSLVRRGDVIATLDDRDARARADQARAAVAAAQAQFAQADADLSRARTLFGKRAMTHQDLDAAEARAAGARAGLARARDALAEAHVALGENVVRAPFDGVVGSRLVDPGDMAAPGRTIVVLHDPASLRIEADVPERCARSLAIGEEWSIRLGEAGSEPSLRARVDEIAPIADPRSRTLRAKAHVEASAGLRPGAFAVASVACGRHEAILVPPSAVRRAGQLETVLVVGPSGARSRTVRTGKRHGDRVEILSGLSGGEALVAAVGGEVAP